MEDKQLLDKIHQNSSVQFEKQSFEHHLQPVCLNLDYFKRNWGKKNKPLAVQRCSCNELQLQLQQKVLLKSIDSGCHMVSTFT